MNEATAHGGPAVLLVGHGTKDAAGVRDFHRLVEIVAERAGVPVAGGFIELSRPPLREAVASLVGSGHSRLGVVPLVLVAAGHAKGDIPAALQREVSRHPRLGYAYGRPLGPHPALLDLLEDRLDAVLDPSERSGTTVVLVGRGSTDPDANAEHVKVARLLWEGRGLAGVEPAFISLASPSVPDALERARLLGARRIVVLPYFLFNGVLPARTAEQALAWAAGRPEVDVRCADVIGPAPALADLALERYREALRGDIRMNCDTCVYRVSLPGHEHRVGAPQQPHDHPDDPAHVHAHA
ncbi:sirohydrochlorin chelatase [Microbispora sp. ATCC PTA-5024]|uniref:sirohydrochlorin chelatase n=1 Tax=Microbispora sp. ATCC PTA-5024 TaxID=316330 RepID=UPI0003DD92C2|nr:sirohydrochlorin chelatase [Microbispora sp. ATCC PTA-5024]ETK37075.1 cobalamin biosynthesis protein CbiX [Microbispora sp. ATCC PTA-5024]